MIAHPFTIITVASYPAANAPQTKRGFAAYVSITSGEPSADITSVVDLRDILEAGPHRLNELGEEGYDRVGSIAQDVSNVLKRLGGAGWLGDHEEQDQRDHNDPNNLTTGHTAPAFKVRKTRVFG